MDFNRPSIENSTADDIADLKQGRIDQARGFDPAVIEDDPVNKPEGMIRWNSALKKFQKLVSAAWADLADLYAINISGNAATATTAENLAGGGAGQIPYQAAAGSTSMRTAADTFTAIKQAATTSATGVVELATNAETLAGTDATRAVTPAGLNYAIANKATKSTSLDLQIRAGSFTTNSDGDVTVTFDEPFSTACVSVVVSHHTDVSETSSNISARVDNKNGFIFNRNNGFDVAITVYYIAVGY